MNDFGLAPAIAHEEGLRALLEGPEERVRVAIADIDGVLRGKYLHRDQLADVLSEGFGFCNGVFGWDCEDALYDNCAYTGWHSGYPDARVRLDLATFRRVPWDDDVPMFLGDLVDAHGSPLDVSPRQLAKRVLARAERMGFEVRTGMEFEWFNFREEPGELRARGFREPRTLTEGMFGYSFVRVAQNQAYFKALMRELGQFGVTLEGLHTENGPGIFEAAIRHQPGIEGADRGFLFKDAVKQIAARFGILPSFMAKWSERYQGCSAHAHQSLGDGSTGLFHDAGDPDGMSATFRSYVAGLVHCLPHVLPLFAPTVNSYKRLVDGFWAPVAPTWGFDNRTAAFRILRGSPRATRVEVRIPGADVNPYLSFAACLASGLYGIEHGLTLEPPAPVTAANRLPRNLLDATRAFRGSPVARELFGETFVEHFAGTRDWEWRQFQDAVTDWELRRYFEII
jgi:glutamine synthetase